MYNVLKFFNPVLKAAQSHGVRGNPEEGKMAIIGNLYTLGVVDRQRGSVEQMIAHEDTHGKWTWMFSSEGILKGGTKKEWQEAIKEMEKRCGVKVWLSQI